MHVGFNPEAAEPLHKSLAKEIDTLLEGKSLAESERTHRQSRERKMPKPKP